MGLENDIAEMLGRYDELADKADAAEARMDGAIATMPAVNLLKNAGMRASDVDGNLVSPLNVFVPAGSNATVTLRAVERTEADFPDALSSLNPNLPNAEFNALEATVSQGSGGSGIFKSMAGHAVRGWVSYGCLGVLAMDEGITFLTQSLTPGTLYTDLSRSREVNWNLDGFEGNVTGEAKRFWIYGPWVCAGREQKAPLFALHEDYHNDVSGRF